MRAGRRPAVAVMLAVAVAGVTLGCAPKRAVPVLTGVPPALVLGEFVDDYGSRHTITTGEWFHQPAIRYRIVKWNPEQQYAIAQNAETNTRSANLWTRIDWMPLSAMAPFEWGFCLSAYDAPSAEAAEETHVAHRERPKTGCNGFPFSRMRRVPAADPG